MYNFSQEQVFIFFLIIGICIGVLYDFFRVLRKAFKTSDSITFIEDIIFLICTGFLIISGILKLNGGEIRLFLFFGISLGILIYLLTISNFCVIILYVFVILCKKIIIFPISCIKKAMYQVKNIIKKDF